MTFPLISCVHSAKGVIVLMGSQLIPLEFELPSRKGLGRKWERVWKLFVVAKTVLTWEILLSLFSFYHFLSPFLPSH